MKVCFKCGEAKDLTDFYRHPQMKDGFLGKCKECTKKDINDNKKKNIEYYRAYAKKAASMPNRVAAVKAYSKTENGKLSHKKSILSYVSRNPEKRQAHIAVGNAVRDGILNKEPCSVCGNCVSEAHHPDYSKPLDVTWLCKKHHKEIHSCSSVNNTIENNQISIGF